MLRKISNKIIVSTTGIIMILMLILVFFLNDILRTKHADTLHDVLSDKLTCLMLIMHRIPALGLDRDAVSTLDAFTGQYSIDLTIVNVVGDLLYSTSRGPGDIMEKNEVKEALDEGEGTDIRYDPVGDSNMFYYAERRDDTIIILSTKMRDLDRERKEIIGLVVTFGTIAIIISALVITIISKRITRPIADTINFSRQFSQGIYTRRINNYSDDEIGDVQRSLNHMADTIMETINDHVLEQKKLSITLDTISDALAVFTPEGQTILANSAFTDFFSIETDPVNTHYYELIRSSSVNTKIEYSLSRNVASSFEETYFNDRVLEIILEPIEERPLKGLLLVAHDITERKRIQQMKADLVSNMSHELKTPITIMKGYLETIRENLADPDISRMYIDKAIENAGRQNAIINDILKLNMIEGTRDFLEESIHLGEIIENCLQILKPKIQEKNIEVILALSIIDHTTPGNHFLAENVLFNLIDNAINYNHEGGAINIEAVEINRRITLTISDTGIGIPPQSQNRIFERFYRVDKGRSRNMGGTGLGLAIVKHSAELLDWQISVSSNRGGTTFTLLI
jgi:two-component system phosphate regulon sensor histidine kinase PhoR